MNRWPDLNAQLERALVRTAADAGIVLAVTATAATPWASVTFTGARHRFTLVVAPSSALDGWLASLPEAELRLRGHLVADLAVLATTHATDLIEVALELLTVEDC